MSYFRDLDEYSDEELENELRERAKKRQKGLCDYCGRPFNAEPACRFKNRHYAELTLLGWNRRSTPPSIEPKEEIRGIG